jgi:hypothetical protein
MRKRILVGVSITIVAIAIGLVAFCPPITLRLIGGPIHAVLENVNTCDRVRAALGDDIGLGWFGFSYGSSFKSSGGFRAAIHGSKASGSLQYNWSGDTIDWSIASDGQTIKSKECTR